MSTTSIKKILLAGTALVAVTAFTTQAQAQQAQTLTASVTWAEAGTAAQVLNDGTDALAGDAVNISTHTLTVENDQSANDNTGGSSNLNAFTLGAVTGTTGALVVQNDSTVTGVPVTASAASIDLTSGNVSVLNANTAGYATTFNVTDPTAGAIIGGNLVITNSNATTADASTVMTVAGPLTVTGTTGISTVGGAGGETATLTVGGNSSFGGAVTVTAGATSTDTATLTLNGGTNAFGGTGLTLADGGSSASLVVSGTAAQSVSGNIKGFGVGQGTLISDNTGAPVTFSGVIGGTSLNTVTLEGAGGTIFSNTGALAATTINATAGVSTFAGAVTAATLSVTGATVDLNNTGTNTITSTVLGTGGVVTVGAGGTLSSAVTAAASDDGTLTFAGGGTVSDQIGASGTEIGTLNAGVENTTTNFSAPVYAQTVNISGGTSGANPGIANFSSLTVAATGTGGGMTVSSAGTGADQPETAKVTGAFTDSGTLNITAASTSGSNATLVLVSGGTIGGVTTLTDVASGGLATLEVGTGSSVTLTGGIGGGATGEGTLKLDGGTQTVTGTVGTTQLLAVDAGYNGTASFAGSVTATTTNIEGAGTVAFGAADNATNVSFAGNDGIVTLAGGSGTFSGNIDDSLTPDKGTLTLLGGTTVTGTVGATEEIKLLNAGVQGTTSAFQSAVNAATVAIGGGADMATTGTVNFDSTLTVGTAMTVSSAGATTAQVENATVTGAFTDMGTLAITAGANSGATGSANAMLTLAGATNTITDATTLTDTTHGLATLDVSGASVTFGTGGIVGNVAGEGTLTLSGTTQTVNGTVGSTAALLAVNAGQAAGAVTTFVNTVDATTVNVGAGSAKFEDTVTSTGGLTFSSVSGATGTAELIAGKNLVGPVVATGGTTTAGYGNVTFDGTNTVGVIGASGGILNGLTLGSATQTTVTTTGSVYAANTTNLGINTLAVGGGGTFTTLAGQTVNTTISGVASSPYGQVTSGPVSIPAGTVLGVNISPTVVFPISSTPVVYNIVTGSSGSVAGLTTMKINGVSDTAGEGVVFTEGVMSYEQVANGDDLTINITRANATTVASTPNNISVATALDTIGTTSGNPALNNVQSAIAAAPSAAAVNNILGTLTPTVDGGSQMVALDVGTQVEGITETRMAALRADDGTTGVAAGAGANGTSMWVQGYGQNATQDERDSVDGYNATTWGGAAGVDSEEIINNGILGFALNYGHAAVDSKNLNATTTDVDNYGFTLYDTVGLQYQMFVDTQLGYAYNKITSVRHNVGGLGVADADGSTHSDQYNAKALLGQDYDMDYDMVITPDVSAAYTRLNTQGYTETGPGSDLTVASNSQNNLDLGLGAEIAWKLKNPDGSLIKPVLHAGYSYAVVDDRIDTTANFVDAGAINPSFVTEGPMPSRNIFDVGAGITYMTTANWDLSANYNYEYRTDYTSNTGTLRMTAHF